MTILIAVVGGVVLTGAIAFVLSFLDHIARCEDNDENNYPSE